ncbi:proteasome subunit alpha type-7-like protein, partial [Tanacetum coccineum]
VVESGGKNIEVAVMTREGLRQLEEAELETIVVEIKAEKAAAEAAKKDPGKE